MRRVVVHHTATSPDASPEQIAQGEVDRGKPGISVHFLIAADGKTYWTQPLELAVALTGLSAVNEDAIGVALIGNFSLVEPGPNQIAAAATLIAWLLSRFELPPEVVVGRRELERVASPGAQWERRARCRDALLAARAGHPVEAHAGRKRQSAHCGRRFSTCAPASQPKRRLPKRLRSSRLK